MLALTAILVVIGSCAAIPRLAPPYYESQTAFSQVRLYLQESVPVENGNLNNTDVQRHRVAGLLVGVTDALVEALKRSNAKNPYDPLKVVDQALPLAWREYNTLAAEPLNKLLSQAQAKVQPITELLQGLCITKTVDLCNRAVEEKVQNGSPYLKRRAKLLVELGDLSEQFLYRKNDVERIVNQAVRLFQDVRSAYFTRFVRQLSNVKDKIRATNPKNVN